MRRRTLPKLGTTFAALVLASPAAASEGGLDIFPDISPTGAFLKLLVLFVVLIPLCNLLVFKPLLGVLEERSARIDGARARASEFAANAQAALLQYEQSIGAARKAAESDRRELLEQARRSQTQTQAEARASAEREIAQVRAQVAGSIDAARAELRREADSLARDVAARVLGRPLA